MLMNNPKHSYIPDSPYLDIAQILEQPEAAFPENFDTPRQANATLLGLCKEAAEEIKKLRKQIKELQSAK
jgi:hypothetical protein